MATSKDSVPSLEVTDLLIGWNQGDEQAFERLVPIVYQELRRIASRYLQGERVDHTLQTTGLVNEAYLRLIAQRRVDWKGELHFYALSARLMRRILVDHSRRRGAVKRGGLLRPVWVDDIADLSLEPGQEYVAVDHALRELEGIDPELSKLVELRFFGGFNNQEISDHLELSIPTITRRFRTAKAWLYRFLQDNYNYGT